MKKQGKTEKNVLEQNFVKSNLIFEDHDERLQNFSKIKNFT